MAAKLLKAALFAQAGAACNCFGNGACTNNVCQCDAGWKGPDCATLDVLPAAAASPGFASRANWGAAQLHEGSLYYTFVGAKRNTSAGASDAFASNAGLHLLRSTSPTGPFEDLGEEIGLNGQSFGFRVDAKINPVDGALLLLTEGYAHGEGFGFIFRRSASGSALGPWTEHLVYELGMRVIDGAEDWTADAAMVDADRWDCRLADPTFVVLDTGEVIVGYRGTRCCCNAIIGAWSSTGEHEPETPGLLRAASWAGPYVRVEEPLFDADVEDMFMWTSARGVHMLMHSQDNAHFNHERRGAYAFSADAGVSWNFSAREAWPTHLALDDCSSTKLAKRQRPSLAFDDAGRPAYLLTGVATTTHGLEWGDGWTAWQPLRGAIPASDSPCAEDECPAGDVGTAGACEACGALAHCPHVTSAPARDLCVCAAPCADARLGAACELDAGTLSETCPHDGWKLLPGTSNGGLFRCGSVVDNAAMGWYGHCVDAAARCNGARNCGDGSFDGQDELACPFVAACDWPTVPRGDGVCLECSPEDVPNCLDAAPALDGATCECMRCATPWAGPVCDVSLAAAPTTAPTRTTPAPTARTALSDGSTGVAPASAAAFVVVVLVMDLF